MRSTLDRRSTRAKSAQFYSLDQCPAYLAHEYTDVFDDPAIDDVASSPLLTVTRNEHEQNQLAALLAARLTSIGPADHELAADFDETWQGETTRDLEQAREHICERAGDQDATPVLFHEFPIEQRIKSWPVSGSMDVVLADPRSWGVEIRIVEIKSGTETFTHHKLQVATYALALRQALAEVPNVSVTASVTSAGLDPASVVTATGALDLSELPGVELAPFENDIELLLEAGGPFDEMLDTTELPAHRLDGRCDSCPHQARCLAHDIATKDLSLLQLPESTQVTLAEHGITDLTDVAELYDIPTDSYERTPTNYDDLEPTDPERVERLQEATDRDNLAELAQIAHRFRRELEPAYDERWGDEANAGPWPTWLVGSGANLPDDDPNDSSWDKPWNKYPKRSLVRVYFTVVPDHVRNRLAYVGAMVTCTRHEEDGNEPLFVTARPNTLPTERDTKDEAERGLFEEFVERLETAVARVAPDIVAEDEDCGPDDGYIHLYCWSERQRDALVDAVKRHPDAYGSQALRKLLGLRKEIDQQVLSVMTDEFRDRHALRYPGLGLVQTVAQFFRSDGGFGWSDRWSTETHDIQEAFDARFFATAVRVRDIGGRLVPAFESGYEPLDGGHHRRYPVLERHRNTLPVEYVWAAKEFDKLGPADADDRATRERIERYRHYDGTDSPRISLDDIDEAIETICAAIHHVERSISYKDAFVPKHPLTVGSLSNEAFGETALQRACVEYQQLDHGARRERRLAQYRRPLHERVVDGEAVVFECSRTPRTDESTIRGDIVRDIGHGEGCVNGEPMSLSPGDWVVVTPLRWERGRLTEQPGDPTNYANSTLAVVDCIDRNTLSLFAMWDDGEWPSANSPHMTWHFGWVNSESAARNAEHFTTQKGREYEATVIERGRHFVVDKAVDDYSAYRAHKALEHASQNPVHNRLVDIYEDEDPAALQGLAYDADATESFVDAFDGAHPEEMNTNQRAFVEEVDHTIVALQGPPGTGKTSMAATPALLARADAHDSGFTGLCTAHSNTAVDELLDDVASSLRRLERRDLCHLKLVRVVTSSACRETPANVETVHYRDDRERLIELSDQPADADTQVVLFGTPVTVRNALNEVVKERFEGYNAVEQMMAEGKTGVFDVALVDEASMMDLPVLLLVGAFLDTSGQLLLVGDHRQMQPIQSHDFEGEDRKPVEDHTPAVSAIDFVRFLRGETTTDLDYLEREPPEWRDPEAVLPMVRLEVTYRLPQPIADLTTELFYHRDGISLESGMDNETIPDVRSSVDSPLVSAALDPETRLTLVVHDENQARNESPLEAALTRRILDTVPTAQPGEGGAANRVSAGVVVPFRHQRQRLRRTLDSDVQVDTVEKFQGGERDLIILSMVAGSQGYINGLADFMLDPNRFNVGASRMRQKLVIVASKALFRAGATGASEYDNQKAWKLLYNEVARDETPETSTTIDGTDIPPLEEQNVSIEVYTNYSTEGSSR